VVSLKVILKGKKHTIVITNPFDKEKKDEIIHLTSNHITIKDYDNDELLVEEDVEEDLPMFESENKLIVDEFKEINRHH
jgi:hypothetical protein